MNRHIVKLGRRELEALENSSLGDGIKHTIEATGDYRLSHYQQLHPIQFSGITFDQLPDSLEISIYQPKLQFHPIDMIYVSKSETPSVKILMSFYYSTWEMPESLGSFIERFVKAIDLHSDIFDVYSEKNDVGYGVVCEIRPDRSKDVYRSIQDLEGILLSRYRQQFSPTPQKIKEKYGEERLHWWIRYVIVPIVCSGGIAAVLVKYLLQ